MNSILKCNHLVVFHLKSLFIFEAIPLERANKSLHFLFTEFICISSATVTQQGVVCPLTSHLTSCIAFLTIIAYIPCVTMLLDFPFAYSGTWAANIPQVYSIVLQLENYSGQNCRGDAWSPVTTQVSYLWPPTTSMSLFHGWQKECQSSSSSGDLWPAAALAAHDPHSWVSDVVSP